jgi:hypothetical protein
VASGRDTLAWLAWLARRKVPRTALSHSRRRGLGATLGRTLVEPLRGHRVVDGAQANCRGVFTRLYGRV